MIAAITELSKVLIKMQIHLHFSCIVGFILTNYPFLDKLSCILEIIRNKLVNVGLKNKKGHQFFIELQEKEEIVAPMLEKMTEKE